MYPSQPVMKPHGEVYGDQRYQDQQQSYDRRELEEVIARLDTQTRDSEASRPRDEELAREVEMSKRRNEELAREIEKLKTERVSQNVSNASSASDSNLWVPELLKHLVRKVNRRMVDRNMVDSIDTLRHKTNDVEAWFQAFDREAKASGWSEKVMGEMLPVKLRDEAIRHWEAIDPVIQHNYASCRKLLVA